jgi:hypothetical protein
MLNQPHSNPFTMHIHVTGLDLVDLSRFDQPTAYRMLGEEVRQQVWKICESKFAAFSNGELNGHIRRVRSIRKTIASRQRGNKTPLPICTALDEYCDCLQSWCEGANLVEFLLLEHQPAVDGIAITPFEVGLTLQDEYAGCQTGVYRDDDGTIIFWHTEEAHEGEQGQRFDRFRLAHFTLDRKEDPVALYSFIYPDLLPGPSFAWRSDGYVQLVDYLCLKPNLAISGAFANLATWVVLRLGMQVAPEVTIRYLAPFYDGYSLMHIHTDHAVPRAERVEFAADKQSMSSLGAEPGAFMFQVNIFSGQSAPLMRELEKDPNPDRQYLLDRIQRTEGGLHKLRAGSDHLRGIHRILKSKDGGPGAYKNPDVKAHLIGRMTATELRLHPTGGWAKGIIKRR